MKKSTTVSVTAESAAQRMLEDEAVELLKRNKMSITAVRKRVLALFMCSDGAMQHNEIEQKMNGEVDRITLYRTLQVFAKKRIIHTVSTDRGVHYAFGASARADNTQHGHFLCEECGATWCVDLPAPVNVGAAVRQYVVRSIDVIVRGLCTGCHTKTTPTLTT